MKASDKAAMRRAIRAAFPGTAQRESESAALCRHVLAWPAYQAAEVIGGYVPMMREADITPLLRDVLVSGRVLALPRMETEGMMSFRRVRSLDELIPGPFGVMEPAPNAEVVPPGAISLLLTPLEAIDRRGMRLGKGGGYYDRFLAEAAPLTAGMVLSWQWTEEVPASAWDIPLHATADCSGIQLFSHEKRKDC